MKKLAIVTVLVLAFAVTLHAGDKTGSITVDISKFRNDTGKASVVLFNDAEAFPKKADKAVKILRTDIKDKKAQVVFENIPYGTYAFVVLHDENANRKMDYNALGMPKEGYAFSNNAAGVLGPPDFKDAAFKVDKPKITQTITIGY